MNFRQPFMLTLVLVLLCVGCDDGLKTGPGNTSRDKPNIVIFFADDLGYGDLGSYGHPNIRTPNLDRLAAEGQRWTDFYVAAPVCSPSRGSLLTGKLPNRTGLYGRQIGVLFPNDLGGMPPGERTLAEALKEQGYATAIIGKWHLGDAKEFYPTRHGFDYWFGLPYSNSMDWVDEPGINELIKIMMAGDNKAMQEVMAKRAEKYAKPRNEYWNVPLISSRSIPSESVKSESVKGESEKGESVKGESAESGFVKQGSAELGFDDQIVERPALQSELTRRSTEEAISFIDSNRRQPFLLYVPYTMPHTPLFRSKAFAGHSLGGEYGDVIEELDWSIGEIVKHLEQLGIAENTLVIFTSDNGPWLTMNHHSGTAGLLRHGKGTTFEGGMRVPGIFWQPGSVKPGVVSDIGSTLDLFVTALSLAGAAPTAGVDGFDLRATLYSGAASPRTHLFYYRAGDLRAYRKGDYKLHLITEGAYGQPPERQEHESPVLYNLRTDPSEKFDIADSHPEVVSQMQADIKQHRASMVEKPPLFDARLAAFQQLNSQQNGQQ